MSKQKYMTHATKPHSLSRSTSEWTHIVKLLALLILFFVFLSSVMHVVRMTIPLATLSPIDSWTVSSM